MVGWICSGWRNVALGLKQLWTHAVLGHEYIRRPNQGHIDCTNHFLSRAGSLPLDVELDCRHFDSHTFVQKLLFPRVDQCRRIKLYVSNISLQSFLQLPPGSFNNLESLNIFDSKGWESPAVELLQAAPQLRRLTLHDILDMRPVEVSIP